MNHGDTEAQRKGNAQLAGENPRLRGKRVHNAAMRKWPRIGFAICILAGVGVIVWAMLVPNEPVYKGKTLSAWLGGHDSSKADAAVLHFGTNAIPILLRMMQQRDSKLKSEFYMFAIRRKLPIHPPESWSPGFYETQLQHVARAFTVLGPSASNAVPGLIQIYRKADAMHVRQVCIDAFGEIGPAASPAVPDIVVATADPNMSISSDAIWAVGKIHSKPELSVPVLINLLQNSNRWVHFYSSAALARFGPDAKSALPTLRKYLEANDLSMRMDASNSVSQIDTEGAAKASAR